MRLIDADALRQEIESKIYWGQVSKDNVESLDEIDDAPTVDAVPVVHGRWDTTFVERKGVLGHFLHICKECKHTYSDLRSKGYNYCPNCGARMDGGNEE